MCMCREKKCFSINDRFWAHQFIEEEEYSHLDLIGRHVKAMDKYVADMCHMSNIGVAL